MSEQFITEEQVERALDWLRDNAAEIGQAKAEMVRAEHMIKHVEALCMAIHGDLSVSAQSREAKASPQYLEAIERYATATGRYEEMKGLREAASLKIEAWRSASANYRAMNL